MALKVEDLDVQMQAALVFVKDGASAYEKKIEDTKGLFFLNSDEMKQLQDKSGNALLEYFQRRLNEPSEDVTDGWVDTEALPATVKEGPYILFQPPQNNVNQVRIQDEIIRTIRCSTVSIQISVYNMTDPFIFTSLLEKANDGVYVRVLLDESQLPSFLRMFERNKRRFGRPPPAKRRPRVSSITGHPVLGGLAHEKFLVSDKRKAITGSYNYTWSAANINRENVTVYTGHRNSVVCALLRHFKEMEESATEFGLQW